MDFNAVAFLKAEEENKSSFFEEIIKNIYSSLSTNYCEYVDNINNIYSETKNYAKAFYLKESDPLISFTENYQKAYNNITNIPIFSDKTKGLSGYVENFVDNSAKNSDIFKVIHKSYDYAENYNSENQSNSAEYKTFLENIKNVENSNSNDNRHYGININMGGITQNITEANSDDVIEILVEKLRQSIAGCGNGIYY